MTGQPNPNSNSNPGTPECHDDVCVTCSDQAEAMKIVDLRPGGLALADTGDGIQEVSVALVEAHVGDIVLVHAKEAIAVLPAGTPTNDPANDPESSS